MVKKLKQLTMQNYLNLKFPLTNLKTFSDVLVAKILLENVFIQPLMLLLSFSDINSAILSSSNETNLLQASHFVPVLFSRAFIKGANARGLGTTHSSCLRHQRPIIDFG